MLDRVFARISYCGGYSFAGGCAAARWLLLQMSYCTGYGLGISCAIGRAVASYTGARRGQEGREESGPESEFAVSLGSAAPDFTLDAAGGGSVSLSDYRGVRNVVLVFLRGFG
ncbi:MAG: redoxin domain-containing protein [Chloroflexi bacterium]|nr:redoxin domain-containing protein [Chloroflexota bacterium]